MSATRFFSHARVIGISLTGLLLITGTAGNVARAEGGLPGLDSIMGGLAIQSSMQVAVPSPLTVAPSAGVKARTVTRSTASMARQSVPARDRAASYGRGDLFTHSQAALPMLVADLRPRPTSSARPMAGRSVGASPAATWTITPVSALQPKSEPTAARTGLTAWSDLR